jgi:predicted transcriptional regulator
LPEPLESRHTVAEAMNQDLAAVSIPPDADALEALGRMQRTGSSRLLVMDGERLVGIVSLKDLLRFLDLKLELEEGQTQARPLNQQSETTNDSD